MTDKTAERYDRINSSAPINADAARTFSMKGDGLAARRLELKSKAKGTRRGVRYQRMRVGKTPAKRKKAAR